MATLTVIASFGSYQQGQSITDPAIVAAILASPNVIYVVKAADSTGTSPGGSGSSGGSGTGAGSSGGGLAPVSYALNAVTSYAATHSFPYAPRATLLDATGAEVETDITYSASQVLLTFPSPFTGTLWLG